MLSPLHAFIASASGGTLVYLYLSRHDVRGDAGIGLLVLLFLVISGGRNYGGPSPLSSLLQSSFDISVFLAAIVCSAIAHRLSPFHPLAQFPGPLANKITGLKLAHMVYTGKRHMKIVALHNKYGSIVRTGPNTLSINSHDAVGDVYAAAKCMDKSLAYRPGRMEEGGLFFIRNRDVHNARRRIWAGAFSQASLERASVILILRSRQLLSCVSDRRLANGVVDLSTCIHHWSYDVMGDLTFGGSNRIELMKDGDPEGVVASGQKATMMFEILGEIPAIFDMLWYLPATKDIHVLDRLAGRLLAARKAAKTEEPDVCSFLLEGRGKASRALTDAELNIDSVFAIQAGSDTTSGVVILLLYYLISNQSILSQLREELEQMFLDNPIEAEDVTRLQDLPYLSAVINEGIRLGTPFPGLPRVIPEGGAILADTFIPERTIVGVPAWAQHISPSNFWPLPLEFKPQRWLPGGLGKGSILNKSAIMTFSFGSFSCLGKTLAIRELYVLTAHLVLAYELTLAPSFDTKRFEDGVLNMRSTIFQHPLLVQVKPRSK